MSHLPTGRLWPGPCSGTGAGRRRGIDHITGFCARQNQDTAHRESLAPLLPATGPSDLVAQGPTVLARWGTTDVPEMAFSVTKSVVSPLAGIAHDDGLLQPDDRVAATVAHPALEHRGGDLRDQPAAVLAPP